MNSQENRESLLEAGFTQAQIEQLSQLRRDHAQREKQQILAEQRRLELAARSLPPPFGRDQSGLYAFNLTPIGRDESRPYSVSTCPISGRGASGQR